MSITAQTTNAAKTDQDHLIAEHIGMARRIARKIARRTPGQVEDDLASAAFVGLTEAAQRYDATRGEPFVAFAAPRIRGAVLDELRRGDLLPRRVRSAANKHAHAVNKLEHQLGRTPEAAEVAGAMGVGEATVRDEIARSAQVRMVSIADMALEGRDIVDGSDLPSAELERAQLIAVVRAALTRLPERDAQVLSLYYVEGLRYVEIGEIIGVSESRVCQLCARAVKRLRTLLGDQIA